MRQGVASRKPLFLNVMAAPHFSTGLLKTLWKTAPKIKIRLKFERVSNSLHQG
jgi:hypothetical protein